jgi:hypothetical protein
MSDRGRGRGNRLLVSLSLANLLAIQVWLVLLRPGQESLVARDFIAASFAVLLLGALLWLLAECGRRVVPAWARSVALGGLWLLILWAALKPALQQSLTYALGVNAALTYGAALLTPLIVLACVARWPVAALRLLKRAALVMAPFVLVTFAQSGWHATHTAPPPAVLTTSDVPLLPSDAARRRTVVLLFDEFDYELAFAPGVRRDALPTLDRLRHESLFGTHAYPPMHSTIMALPAMLTGRLVAEGQPGPESGDFLVRFDQTTKFERFSAQTTVFSRLRQAGLSSLRLSDALLPQARMEGPADADWVVAPFRTDRSTWQRVAGHLVTICASLPMAKGRGWDAVLSNALGVPSPSLDIEGVAGQIVDLAGNADVDVVFAHLLLPHLPVVYDTSKRAFGTVVSTDYRDNLPAVDLVVAKVVERLKEQGRLEYTQLLLVSDHFFRFKRAAFGYGDHRVPFLLRFGNDARPVGDMDHPFNTILLAEMLLDVAQARINNSAELESWIRQRAEFGKSPLLKDRVGW